MGVGHMCAWIFDECRCVMCIYLVCRCLGGPISPLLGPPRIGPRSQQIWVYLSCISVVSQMSHVQGFGMSVGCVCALVLDASGCVECVYLVCRSFYNPQSPHLGQPISTHLDSVILVYLQCISFFIFPTKVVCIWDE